FDGENSKLQLKPQSIVQLGTNAKIKFTNGAYLDANGATFSATNSNNPYVGLVFENAGTVTINNCTFNNAISPINIINQYSYTGYNKVITNNTFNLPSAGMNKAIYAENVYRISVQGNAFNLSPNSTSIGLYFNNSLVTKWNNINIVGNNFYNGSCSMVLACYASVVTPFYVYGNNFYSNNAYNIIGRLMTGDIKNNNTHDNFPGVSITLYQSNPNLYRNNLNANNINIMINNSFPRLAPVRNSNNQYVWDGGENTLNTSNVDNIDFNESNAFLDFGQNLFGKGLAPYHLYGNLSTTEDIYYVRNNCFENHPNPDYWLWISGTEKPITAYWEGSNFNCNFDNSFTNYVITDRGYGINDTTFISLNNTGMQSGLDEGLYSQASENMRAGNYLNAKTDYKNLINNFKSSHYLNTALYDLFDCYQKLDTSSSPNYRITLFTDLIAFLNEKIVSGNYDDDFIEIAYNLTVMCKVNTTEYSSALDGFEFISLYNPNPYVRLYASWDYTQLEEIIGAGGSESEKYKNENDETFLKRRTVYYENLINDDPALKKVKNSYKSKKQKAEKSFESDTKKREKDIKAADRIIKNKKESDYRIENKAISNIRTLKYLTKADKNRRQIEDIFLAANSNNDRIKSNSEINNTIPDKFDLSQNYPNPFNPITEIEFSIPKNNIFVQLTIYDISGREVTKLVNQQMNTGIYKVKFDGNYYSSGVYFYRLTTDGFSETKKMILMK
ncbi:MAG TPA: T9SS type A sorting domain-containing protein, partial [Ignavibacteria bacterium]